jgi:hypothetical protein
MHRLALVRAAGEVPSAVVTLQAWADSPQSKLPSDRACAAGSPVGPVPSVDAAPACPVDAAALPTVLSPFRWRLIREYSTGYAISDIDLARPRQAPALASEWRPSEASPWVHAASATRSARIFLSFSRFPAARVVERRPDEVVVRIKEIRFPFGLLVRLGANGQALEERFGN